MLPAQAREKSSSLISLVFANTIPLLGVIFFGWDLFLVMMLYWLESAVIGLYNICKLIKIGGIESAIMAPFFAVHYSGFMWGHLLFISVLFGRAGTLVSPFSIQDMLLERSGELFVPLLALLVSHGLSFYLNFLGNREYAHKHPGAQMFEPYKRIFLMQLTLIVGGAFIIIFDLQLLAVVLLIILKTLVDAHAHLREHSAPRKRAKSTSKG